MFWTIVSSCATAIATLYFTQWGNDVKALRDTRETLYVSAFKELDRLLNDPGLVFNDDYYNFLINTRYKIKLLSSNYVVSTYSDFFNFCMEKKKKYDEFQKNHDLGELEDEQGVFHGSEEDIRRRDNQHECFMQENIPLSSEVGPLINRVLIEMRYDLGNPWYGRSWRNIQKIIKILSDKFQSINWHR